MGVSCNTNRSSHLFMYYNIHRNVSSRYNNINKAVESDTHIITIIMDMVCAWMHYCIPGQFGAAYFNRRTICYMPVSAAIDLRIRRKKNRGKKTDLSNGSQYISGSLVTSLSQTILIFIFSSFSYFSIIIIKR